MPLDNAFIPYGGYWSSPFCRWQGSLATFGSIQLAANTTKRFLGSREIPADSFDGIVLGWTVPQHQSFYGAPWFSGTIGAGATTGPMIAQACATSARSLATAAMEVQVGTRQNVLAVTCDRTSNGPHLYYPDPGGVGGRGTTEEWVWDNFNADPLTGKAMGATAENVAKETGITREEQDAVALLRYGQYQAGMANDRAFQKRYMFALEVPAGRKQTKLIEEDEGIFPTTAEGLAKLRPAMPDGTLTFGTQTHPADGNAGMIVCTKARAAEISRDAGVTVQVLGFGDARVKPAFMPMAPVPAAKAALAHAGIKFGDVAVIKTHNPFALNDVYFSKTTGVPVERMNNYGSPLVYGHPQGPTGMRAIVEMIEELVMTGGGYGLFTGCAAGDTAMAAVLRVDC